MNDADTARRIFAQAFANLAIKASFSEGESRLIVDQITGKSPMKAPTEQQLKDPAWWDSNCAPWAITLAIETDARGGFERIHQRSGSDSSVIEVAHPDNDITLYHRPTKPEPCRVCEESPCGHYNECPPGMPKTETAKPYINTGLPRVGANSENSGLVITCVTPQVKSWEVLATRKGEAVVYAPACDENGTDQAEVYLMSAAEFKDPRAERERDDLLTVVLEGFRKSRAEPASTPELNLLSEFANYLYHAGMLRKGASDER